MKISQPGAHIDHMLRQTRMHNMQLSTMADMKASLLLTISSIVFGSSLARLTDSPHEPAFIILAVACVLTVILAIYATMPKAGPMPFFKKKADIGQQGFTLLFFGDYAKLAYQDFEKRMEDTMNDHSLTYQEQVKEIYNTGAYLAKHKYHKLRLAYTAFLIGIVSAAALTAFKYLS